MTSNRISVFEFLSVSADRDSINGNLSQIRSNYSASNRNVVLNDQTLRTIAQKLGLLDDRTNLEHLKLCLTEKDEFDLRTELVRLYITNLIESETVNVNGQPNISMKTTIETELVREITCYIHIKKEKLSVEQFIEEFLFTPLIRERNDSVRSHQTSRSTVNIRSSSTSARNRTEQLAHGCVLDVFIRSQLSARGVIDSGHALSKLQLAEALTIEDEFDTWYFDYMRSLFDIWLLPSNAPTFPLKWSITEDAHINFRTGNKSVSSINDMNQSNVTNNTDRPSTISLEKFIEDICEKENNGNKQKWLDGLRAEDIRSYAHLANLKFSEWEQMKTLSTNARKILKSYVDREKQLAAEVKKVNQSESDLDEGPKLSSRSELIASLHQIKLYFHFILDGYFERAGILQPPKIDPRCVNLSFEEMRNEGFADDGLFDQMKPFFLPLSIVQQDLEVTDIQWNRIKQNLTDQLNSLRIEKAEIEDEMARVGRDYYQLDDKLVEMRSAPQNRFTTAMNHPRNDRNENNPTYIKQQMDTLQQRRNQLRVKWNRLNDSISSIERALESRNTRNNDLDLIKPNRGFIMFGPPGTGKSDIMSKVSTRIGINMVAPPIAAGELDRPLVGESERIINDICMRCHRLPYLMCCVSIDEIDSLAPKRTEQAAHSDVSKLSVLLSVIDGIKDIRNLMFFCATNRLNMMDEAFLRRMSGKFFVGRPSSRARKIILSGMKTWHSDPLMLDDLAIATTNFSGAALRALRRSITAHCITFLRTDPSYRINYRTVLEHAHETALKYRIMIGAETIPTLLLRNMNERRPVQNWGLSYKTNSVYTGKILFNLSRKKVYVEAIVTHNNNEKEKIVYQDKLLDTETDLKQLIERLIYYGKSRNVQLLQLVDLNLLLAESAYNEEKKFEILKERVEECTSYRRSMIVFDLDSLIGVNKSEGQASMGNSTNLSLINQNVNIYIQEKFRDAYCQIPLTSNRREQDEEDFDKCEEKWSVIVVREPYIYRQFCSGDHQFTRPPEDIDEEEEERRRSEESLMCVKCKIDYTEQENDKTGQCTYHDGFVYDCSSIRLQIFSQSGALQTLITEEADFLSQTRAITNEQKERHERHKQRFRYICCHQTLQTSSTTGGCKKGKHQNLTDEQWDHQCMNNGYYLQKWGNLTSALR